MKKDSIHILFEADVLRLDAVKEFICTNLDKDLGIAAIATKFGVSQSTLRRHFKHYYGVTLYHFIYECRMKKAMEFLKEHRDNITWIASALSYKNPSSFTRAFFKYYRRTPLYYLKTGVL